MRATTKVKVIRLLIVAAFIVAMVPCAAYAASGKITTEGGGKVISFTRTTSEKVALDYAHAKPMPLPQAAYMPDDGILPKSLGTPGYSPGAVGSGKTMPVTLPTGGATQFAAEVESSLAGIEPQEYGTAGIPYTTSRVDLTTANYESRVYPYRAAGKLYFKIGTSTYVCSASLIKRGVVVTAAHCVANFGHKQFYSGWQFIPAMSGSGSAPYGVCNWSSARVLWSYYAGTDSCSQTGVVCRNDVAILTVAPQSGVYPGTYTGWLGFGWNGWGFTSSKILVNQLGYPVGEDYGYKMQRTDSQGSVNTSMSSNTVWGSRQTGGSSGGPEVANLGIAPVFTGDSYGSAPNWNIVVGVTSWGYTASTPKAQGASPFLSTNVKYLVDLSCGSPVTNPACQ